MVERRRAERFHVAGELTGRLEGVGEAPVIDISLGGALVEIGESKAIDDTCRLALPGHDGEEIQLTGRVRRCQASRYSEDGLGGASYRYRVALQFTDVAPAAQSRLERLLERIAQRSASPDTARIAVLARELS
jgi:hypothetical protein